MNFVRSLFSSMLLRGEPRSPLAGYVLQWEREVRKAPNITPQLVFGSLAQIVLFYEIPETEKPTDYDHFFRTFPFNDAVLFEMSCYTFFNADVWVVDNTPQLRKTLSPFFASEFMRLLSPSLGESKVVTLFNQRVHMYTDFIKSGVSQSVVMRHLEELILHARSTGTIDSYDYQRTQLTINDAFTRFEEHTNLEGFHLHILPKMEDMLSEATKGML